MSKFVVVVFSDEVKAYKGTQALKELHGEGSISLYGTAVVTKNKDGSVVTKAAATDGVLGTAVGALTGGLIGLLGGPVGAAIGMTGGALLGAIRDLVNSGVSTDFVETVSEELKPGRTAVIAELNETWLVPLDTRMKDLGGVVLRTPRTDVEDEQISRQAEALKDEIAKLRDEYEDAKQDARTALDARIEEAKSEIDKLSKRVNKRTDELKKETQAKIDELQKQANKSASKAKTEIEKQISLVRSEYDKRSAKLENAWELTKEALKV